ncbi:hypothetical protein [Candidatus Vondammii sp. HM_W22]|uniref:hypothetical protein n=1 Tax=Candidatus Vondammii sp. HM_W22 TaxID=2687299 RepID=UPI001F13EFAD|nr:hypothetical protein [Candidatus Vondammii sp. HM_W22]
MSIGNRRRFDYWRGDSIEGAKGSGGIATHVKRKSRVLVAAKLSDKSTDTFYLATTTAFKITPEKWRKTVMVDNGKEYV